MFAARSAAPLSHAHQQTTHTRSVTRSSRQPVPRHTRALTISCSHQGPADFAAALPLRAGAAALSALLLLGAPAGAELNKFEANQTGEFNLGTAKQLGAIKLDNEDLSGQDLRRSNFTSSSLRNANLSNTQLKGAYFVKAVAYRANFENADVTDVLFDRAVLVEANLKNANFSRTILTLSDLRDADIEGADFTDALLDRPQKTALCKYASGTNSVTGNSTRTSLGCGKRRSGTPSNYMTDDSSEKPAPAFSPDVFSAYSTGNASRSENASPVR